MEQRRQLEVLSLHADRLREEIDLAPELLAQVPADERGSLAGLMSLAGRVGRALAPVEPRPAFVRQLKTQLVEALPGVLADAGAREGRRRELVWTVAGVGGVLSVLGLGFLTFRAAAALSSKIS